MANGDLSPREEALRRLPLVYSLALRLREAGVAPELICEYVNVETASLDNILRVAEAKLRIAQRSTGGGSGDDESPVRSLRRRR